MVRDIVLYVARIFSLILDSVLSGRFRCTTRVVYVMVFDSHRKPAAPVA